MMPSNRTPTHPMLVMVPNHHDQIGNGMVLQPSMERRPDEAAFASFVNNQDDSLLMIRNEQCPEKKLSLKLRRDFKNFSKQLAKQNRALINPIRPPVEEDLPVFNFGEYLHPQVAAEP
jgi:hypothetical protein